MAGLHAPVGVALREVLSGTAAERVLDSLLRRLRPAQNDVRRALAEALFGVGLWRRRLAWHAGAEHPSHVHPQVLLFVLMRDLAGISEDDACRYAGLTSPPSELPARRPVPEAWRVRESFPDWLADHLERELGAEAAQFAVTVNSPGPVALRANALVAPSLEQLRAELAGEGVITTPARWAPSALIVNGSRPNILGLRAYQRGAFEVQDEGSQLLGALVNAQPGETVLDFCAGAGGKTLQLASAMGDAGVVHAWNIDAQRLVRLQVRARRAHVRNIRIHRAPPPRSLLADRVLVDAPCSELGPLRRGPDVRWRLDPSLLQTLPRTQLEILETASSHVRPGGRLVYATCTIHRAENQALAIEFESNHPDFERLTPGDGQLSPELIRDDFFVALPHRHGTDGFFAVVWQRVR